MCNAWNHPINCMCGWGGDGHLGKSPGGNILSNGLRVFDTKRYDSYLNPNAKCPVCGEPVYFFKSKNGGRVFFDEIGPPWPKHPCTDNTKYINIIPSPINQFLFKTPVWQINGWHPVIIENITQKSAYAFSIARIGYPFVAKIQTMIYGFYADELTKFDLIIYAKRKEKLSILLTAFNVNKDISFELEINYTENDLDAFFSNN